MIFDGTAVDSIAGAGSRKPHGDGTGGTKR